MDFQFLEITEISRAHLNEMKFRRELTSGLLYTQPDSTLLCKYMYRLIRFKTYMSFVYEAHILNLCPWRFSLIGVEAHVVHLKWVENAPLGPSVLTWPIYRNIHDQVKSIWKGENSGKYTIQFVHADFVWMETPYYNQEYW